MSNEQNKRKIFLKWFLGTLVVIVGLFILFFIVGIIGMTLFPNNTSSTPNIDDPTKISIAKYGDSYPFTIDNLTLKCENDAVWVEDKALNKYALNGLAYNKLNGRGDFKGYSTIIEKPNPDLPGTTFGPGDMLSRGLELCKQNI